MVSLRDIARKARTSIGTVDRVLHNRGRVSKEMSSKVMAIVSRHGYKPNIYARNLSLGKTFTLGVLMPAAGQDGSYWGIPARGIRRAEKELRPYRVQVRVFHYDRYSDKSFWSAARRCRSSKIDGLLLAPVLQEIAAKALADLFSGIPYVFFDSVIAGARPIATVSQDPFQSGVLAGNLMRKLLPAGGDIAAVKVTPGDDHIEARIRGFLESFRNDRRYAVHIHEAESRIPGLLSKTIPLRILQRHRARCGVFVSNAWTHPLARYFLHHAGREHVHLIGYDLIPENRVCLKNGAIDFLISQRPAMQGYDGIMALYRSIVLREHVSPEIIVPLDIVTRESYMYYQD